MSWKHLMFRSHEKCYCECFFWNIRDLAGNSQNVTSAERNQLWIVHNVRLITFIMASKAISKPTFSFILVLLLLLVSSVDCFGSCDTGNSFNMWFLFIYTLLNTVDSHGSENLCPWVTQFSKNDTSSERNQLWMVHNICLHAGLCWQLQRFS